MGYALAAAAVDGLDSGFSLRAGCSYGAGWSCALPSCHSGRNCHQVDALFDACDILIMSAAVCDFRPRVQHASKEKKDVASSVVEFERT